jgi:hypothetical protein
VHEGDSRVSYFVDGRSVLFALCCAFLKARSSLSGELGNDSRVGTVPPEVRLTQTIKYRNEHGKLLSIEIRAVLGELVSEPVKRDVFILPSVLLLQICLGALGVADLRGYASVCGRS